MDAGGNGGTGNILSIVATCIARDVNPRAYLHRVVLCILHGAPQDKLRDLLPTACSRPTPSSMRVTPTRSLFRARIVLLVGDDKLTAALLDRLGQHADVLVTRGPGDRVAHAVKRNQPDEETTPTAA